MPWSYSLEETLFFWGAALHATAMEKKTAAEQYARSSWVKAGRFAWKAALPMLGTGLLAASTPFSLLALFLTFLKLGAVVYGSGYTLLAFLRTDLVQNLHWLTDKNSC